MLTPILDWIITEGQLGCKVVRVQPDKWLVLESVQGNK